MRGWYGSMLLIGCTIGGVFWIFSGSGEQSHCGPCLSCECDRVSAKPSPQTPPSAPVSCSCPAEPRTLPVIDLVELRQAPELAPAPRLLAEEPHPAAAVIPAGFSHNLLIPERIPLADDDAPF